MGVGEGDGGVSEAITRILLAPIMFQCIRVIMNKLSSVIILKHLNGMQTEGGHPPSYQFGVSLSLVTTDKPEGKGAGIRQSQEMGTSIIIVNREVIKGGSRGNGLYMPR